MASSLSADFDTHTQTFTLITSDGQNVTANLGELDYYRQYGIRVAINWGSQIGASIVLLLVLLLLTPREKRKSHIFVMNCVCLVLNAIRSILQCIWLTTEYMNPYVLATGDYSRIKPSDRANTIATETLLLLLTICIMVSLSLQVWVVCVTTKPLHRIIAMCITGLLATLAVALRFAVCALTNVHYMKDESMTGYNNTVLAMHIAQAAAVWAYALVFTWKLGIAMHQRRRMRMTQFGPMQVIFIMGCHTLIIPGMSSYACHTEALTNSHLAIFTSLQGLGAVPEMASQNTTVICIFLPLSAIWAGLISEDAAARVIEGRGSLLRDQFFNVAKSASSIDSDGKSFCEKKSSVSTYNSGAKSSREHSVPSHEDFALSRADIERSDAIYVGRGYTIENDKAPEYV
jgi:pheromone alpha factor receptor